MKRFMRFGSIGALSLALLFGAPAVTNVAAQDTPVEDAVDDEDDGFDDWGLLGLLGLAGLLGLRGGGSREVHVDRRPVEPR